MPTRDRIPAKLADVATRIERIRRHQKPTADELTADQDALDLVSFNLWLALQMCADLAGEIIGDEGMLPARSFTEAFARLAENQVVTAEAAHGMQHLSSFRDLVAYADADPSSVHRAATDGVAALERYLREVAAWSQRPA